MGIEAATPANLWERVRSIAAEEVQKFARSGFLRNARITGGGLTVSGEGALRVENVAGGTAAYIGGLTPRLPDGSLQPGVILRREDGTLALALYDPDPAGVYKQFLALYDRAGNIVLSDDTESGQGLARPYVPGGFYRARYGDWGVAAVTETFETLWRGEVIKQHPRLSVATLASTDTSGVTAELRVLVDGVPLGTTATIGFAQTTTLFGPAAVAGAHMKLLTVEIQARRIGTIGAIRVEPLHMLGRQS